MLCFMLETSWLGSLSAENDLKVLLDSKLNVSQSCVLAAKISSNIPNEIQRTTARSLRGLIIEVLYSALDKYHPKSCIWFWAPQYRKDVRERELF